MVKTISPPLSSQLKQAERRPRAARRVLPFAVTPPTETVDGEYIYRVTIRSAGRAAASSITTEPLRMVIPAGSGADPDPVPDPRPETEDTYYIAVLKADGGQVIPNVRYAAQGDRVTVSAHPDGGYELSELTVTDIRGRSLTVRELGENRFSFTMPNVKVRQTCPVTSESYTALS